MLPLAPFFGEAGELLAPDRWPLTEALRTGTPETSAECRREELEKPWAGWEKVEPVGERATTGGMVCALWRLPCVVTRTECTCTADGSPPQEEEAELSLSLWTLSVGAEGATREGVICGRRWRLELW